MHLEMSFIIDSYNFLVFARSPILKPEWANGSASNVFYSMSLIIIMENNVIMLLFTAFKRNFTCVRLLWDDDDSFFR